MDALVDLEHLDAIRLLDRAGGIPGCALTSEEDDAAAGLRDAGLLVYEPGGSEYTHIRPKGLLCAFLEAAWYDSSAWLATRTELTARGEGVHAMQAVLECMRRHAGSGNDIAVPDAA